jgi:hypothetical protein
MTLLFPGALWVPVPGQQNRPRRRTGRGVGLHVAAYLGPSIEKIDEGTGNDSHLYVRRDGSVEQNVDLDRVSYAMVDGNATLITVETEGGADPATVNSEPWTPQQVATLAEICRWAHETEDVPLQVMPDSRPASKGIGTHRLGIDPYRVAGGEVWSTAYGKACPGTAKVAQVPAIVALSLNPTKGFLMALTDAEQTEIRDTLRELRTVKPPYVKGPTQTSAVIGDIFVHARQAAVSAAASAADADAVASAVVAKLGPATGGLTAAQMSAVVRDAITQLVADAAAAHPTT